ncbi:MAG: FAD-binding oxidoreductase [Myxococcales bacterium]|nr:FAD-binding oxidoreductase [Myxococcales bacterium]
MPDLLPTPFLAAVAREFPPDFASTDPAELHEYGRDWTRVYPPAPSLVTFPRTTAEVARLLALAHDLHVPIVPSGGRTGLAGGAMAACGEVVLSLARMRRMDPVDVIGATVRVQAGAVTETVHQHAAAHGLTWPVDFASKGSSQVGGNLATNAGGINVIRYGLTRQWVLGLQVVLAGGRVLELGGALEKDNTGLDLRQLFIGSEGTLGVITEATLKLTRRPGRLDVVLCAVDSLAGVLQLFQAVRQNPSQLMAYEFFTDVCLRRLLSHRPLRPPFARPSSHYVLIELERAEGLEDWVVGLADRGLVADAVLAQGPVEAAALWALREGISESLAATGVPHKNDIAVPIAALEAFTHELMAVFPARYPGWEIALFGHVGDGNLHLNVMKPADLDVAAFKARTAEADRDVFELVARHGGSVSAEHGIGLLKRAALPYTRPPEQIALMRSIKAVFDPHGILNPGKAFAADVKRSPGAP